MERGFTFVAIRLQFKDKLFAGDEPLCLLDREAPKLAVVHMLVDTWGETGLVVLGDSLTLLAHNREIYFSAIKFVQDL